MGAERLGKIASIWLLKTYELLFSQMTLNAIILNGMRISETIDLRGAATRKHPGKKELLVPGPTRQQGVCDP